MMNELAMNASLHPFLIPDWCLDFRTDGVASFATLVPTGHFLSCHWGALPGRAARKQICPYNCSIAIVHELPTNSPAVLDKEPIQAGDPQASTECSE